MSKSRERATFDEISSGVVTLAEVEGMTAAEAYSIADFGWMLLEQGRSETAAIVFETLAIGNPRHAYFHALHGVALQRCGSTDLALDAFGRALEADPLEASALVHRAEILLGRARPDDLCEAACLLARALELDPEGSRRETRRARMLARIAAPADG